MYKYLLWDIDGTVLDFLAAEEYAIKTLFVKYGLGECSDEMLSQYSRINVKYWEALERNEMSKPEILVGRFREFFAENNIDVSLAEKFNKEYQTTLGDHVVFVKNAKEMLLSEKNKYILIAVTNGTKIAQTKKLQKSGLDKIFDAVYISEDVGIEKPNAGYFEHVFIKSGINNPKEALLIGDSLTSDMRGGEIAGIDTCWYNPNHTVNNKNITVTYEISDLAEIEQILSEVEKND